MTAFKIVPTLDLRIGLLIDGKHNPKKIQSKL
jgi:hypothetical protein